MSTRGPKPSITNKGEDVLKKRVRACIERFRYYEERMKTLAKENERNYDRVIYNASANVWSLAADLLMYGPVKKITDETLSGKRGINIQEKLERSDDDEE